MPSRYESISKVQARILGLSVEQLRQSLKLAETKDVTAISNVRRAVFGQNIGADDEAYLLWRYFRHSDHSDMLVFWYADEIIAAIGIEPIELKACDKISKGVKCTDIIVKPEHDGRGLGAWITLYLQEKYEVVIGMGSNAKSLPMLKKLFTPLAVRSYFKLPLDCRHYIANHVKSKWLCLPLVIIANIALGCRNAWIQREIHTDTKIVFFEYGHLNRLIQNLSEADKCLLGQTRLIRSRGYLQWRYLHNIRNQFFGLAATDSTGRVVSHIIGMINSGNNEVEGKKGYIMDWGLYDDGENKDILAALFKESIKYFRKQQCEFVNLLANDKDSTHAAKAVGFFKRHTDSRLFLFAKTSVSKSAFERSDWFITYGDTDGF